MDIFESIKLAAGTLATAAGVGAAFGITYAMLARLPNDDATRYGYIGTACGFATGVLIAILLLLL